MAVRNDNDDVGRKLFKELLHFRRANFFRLMHGEMRGKRDILHRRNRDLLAATTRTVRLGDDGEKLEIRLGEKMLQSRNSKLRRAAENNPQPGCPS